MGLPLDKAFLLCIANFIWGIGVPLFCSKIKIRVLWPFLGGGGSLENFRMYTKFSGSISTFYSVDFGSGIYLSTF